jgi:hypothetical protein
VKLFALFMPIAILAGSAESAGTSSIDPEAVQVMNLTRQTKSTYSAFNWNVITPPGGKAFEEWAAEFHSGSLHRVETPRDRIVADCSAMTATYLNLASGEMENGAEFAKRACGIADHLGITNARMLPSATGRYGPVRRVIVEDSQTVRTYSVDAKGIIVEEQISLPDGTLVLDMHVVAVKKSVPQGIFTVESLHRSAVPVRYKVKLRPGGQLQ